MVTNNGKIFVYQISQHDLGCTDFGKISFYTVQTQVNSCVKY